MLFSRSSRLLFSVSICFFALAASSHELGSRDSIAQSRLHPGEFNDPLHYDDPLPLSTRHHWMRLANTAVLHAHTPCPFMAFGTVIVNHTLSFLDPSNLGDVICTGLNHNNHTANPILDGEIAAIENCSAVLTDPSGRFKLSIQQAIEAYSELTIYTNGEPCPMCASAINWTGFREMVFGSRIRTLVGMGWPQIRVDSRKIFEESWDLRRRRTAWIADVLSNETDRVFEWQFQHEMKCPVGCARRKASGRCLAI